MVSDFLTGLSQQIQDKYGSGETAKNIYGVIQNGSAPSRNQLGDFAGYFSKNTQRSYLEEGYLRLDPFSVEPKLFEALLQEPDAVVLLKKRAFSTLAESYRPDMMDAEEKLYMKATKILFANKCSQISAMEKLTKIARVSSAIGQLDDQLMPLIISLIDSASSNFSDYSPAGASFSFGGTNVGGGDATSFQKLHDVVNKIRKVYAFSPINSYTTWVTDLLTPFQSTLAQGTGTIELTNVTDITTTTTTDSSGGSFSLTISDPYGLMRVTEGDIEWALQDALNFVSNLKLFQQGRSSLQDLAATNLQQLNAVRRARGVSSIQLLSDPNVILGNLITAILENSGDQIRFSYDAAAGLFQAAANSGVKVSIESLIGGPDIGNNGLTPDEVNLFATAIITTFAALNYVQSAASTVFADPSGKSSLNVNFVRNKLRFHYGNKLVAQPMDRVHVYLGSKSRTDNKIMTGISNMFSGLGYLQNVNNTAFAIKDQFNTLFNPSGNIDMQLEKTAFVGADFPNGLWAMMRNTFIADKSGAHVFGGLVTDSKQSRSPGKFTVSISGKDNTYFFDLGTINLNPGVDNFAGPLYDPLTPYKTRFDAVSTNFKDNSPEFLDENKQILGSQTFDKGLIKFKSGRYAGKPVTLSNFTQDSQITKDGKIRNVIHGPAGLVYKWKEGMGTFTYNADSFSATDPERIGIPPITNDPFAGQDIMNTLSLLITGTPYNYATYFKAVSEFDQTSRDPQTGQDPAASFYNALSSTLQKNDLLWGGFVPFKGQVIDEASFQAAALRQQRITDQNNVINGQLQKVQDLKNRLYIAQGTKSLVTGVTDSAIQSLQNQLTIANAALNDQLAAGASNLATNVPIVGIGNDPSHAPTSGSSNLSDPKVRSETRRLTNFLTRRLSYMVRANEDKNLLIIDDSYDKDYDIIAYEKALNNSISQFNSEYTSVRSKIISVSSLLNLEVFCDSQGHIRIRPQQYNKVPSSVFYRMMQMKRLNGIQIFPQFLEDLYVDQINSLMQSLEVLELQIRLDGAVIGISDDIALSSYLNDKGNAGFLFFSNRDGDIIDVGTILANSNPDQIISNIPQDFIKQVQGQSQISSVFSSVNRAQKTQAILTSPGITTTLISDDINRLISKIFIKSGQQVTLDNFLVAIPSGPIKIPSPNIVDVVKVTQDLSDKVNQRQQLVKTLSSVLNNAKEFKSLDNDSPYSTNNVTNKLLSPQSYGNQQVPTIFAHMIEDETFDDYGIGSGSRYIIHNYQVLQMDVSETPPEFTMLEVQGQIDPFISNNALPFSNSGTAFAKGGNAIITAAAVDYDLWRMYGFRNISSIAVPFLSDPEKQCAPYAVSILSRVRKEILQGSVTIAGNEFMQPGEVVFIEDMGLLFYVTSVTHSFSFGSRFTTSLTLKYGHNPGEYIPTPLDIIGKALYNSRDISGFVNYRQTNVFNERPIGAIVILPQANTESSDPLSLLTIGNEGSFNLKIINNLLYSAAGIVATSNFSGSNVNAQVELRIFFDQTLGSIDKTLSSVRDTLKGILTGTIQVANSTITNPPPHLSDANVILADIDISAKNETRSPSQRACDQGRNAISSYQGLSSQANPLPAALAQCVIDCILTFKQVN